MLNNHYSILFETVTKKSCISLFLDDSLLLTEYFLETESHSKDLLSKLGLLFESNNISKKNLSFISVINGPGSFTSIRVGISIALGLAKALEIPIVGVNLTEVIKECKGLSSDIIYLLVGKTQVISEQTDIENIKKIKITDIKNVLNSIRNETNATFRVDRSLYSIINEELTEKPDNVFMLDKISEIAGKLAFAKFIEGNIPDIKPDYLEFQNG